MKNLVLFLIIINISGCAYFNGMKTKKVSQDKVISLVIKKFPDKSFGALYSYTEESSSFRSWLGSAINSIDGLGLMTTNNVQSLAKVIDIINSKDNGGTIVVYGDNSFHVKNNITALRFQLAGKKYSKVFFIYAGNKEYDTDAQRAVEFLGMKYGFVDIDEQK